MYSFPFHVDIKAALEYLNIKPIDLKRNNELKHCFETSESKIVFYDIYVTKEKF